MNATTTPIRLTIHRLSPQPKLGVRGPRAETWLRDQGIEPPSRLFSARRAETGDWILRYGAQEFFIAPDGASTGVASLRAALPSAPQVYETPREETTLILEGADCHALFAQTCAIDFSTVARGIALFTRIAGVSCAVLPDAACDGPRFIIWVDPSYADYLWETLAEIAADLGGEATDDVVIADSDP